MKPGYVATELRLVRDKVQSIPPKHGSEARALALVLTKIDEALLWLGTLATVETVDEAAQTQETRRQEFGLTTEAD